MRKTISVEYVKTQVNHMLKHSRDSEGRDQLIFLLDSVLMSTGNYNGFTYLTARDMSTSAHGTTVGVGDQNSDGTFDFENTDRTRVQYF